MIGGCLNNLANSQKMGFEAGEASRACLETPYRIGSRRVESWAFVVLWEGKAAGNGESQECRYRAEEVLVVADSEVLERGKRVLEA